MTAITSLADTDSSTPRRSLSRIFALESYYELLKVLRLPAYLIPTLLFPAMFYLLFGVAFGRERGFGDTSLATYLLATYGAFGVIGAALLGFGVSCAIERGQGWTLLKQASPMPTSAYFVAKLLVSWVMSACIIAILIGLGLAFGGVAWQPAALGQLTLILLAGVVPFNAFGVLLGLAAGPNSAPAIANLIYLPMGFLSGLWIPIEMLPSLLQKTAAALPAYHFGQLALKPLGASMEGSLIVHVGYLLVFAAISFALAAWLWKRDEGQTFG